MCSCLAVALSGGIDSLVAAALLKEQGHRLIGLHFLTGYEAGIRPSESESSSFAFDAIRSHAQRTMESLSQQLDIPIHLADLRAEFRKRVVNYFVDTYANGKTPNPCLVCNHLIKFDILLSKAIDMGGKA